MRWEETVDEEGGLEGAVGRCAEGVAVTSMIVGMASGRFGTFVLFGVWGNQRPSRQEFLAIVHGDIVSIALRSLYFVSCLSVMVWPHKCDYDLRHGQCEHSQSSNKTITPCPSRKNLLFSLTKGEKRYLFLHCSHIFFA